MGSHMHQLLVQDDDHSNEDREKKEERVNTTVGRDLGCFRINVRRAESYQGNWGTEEHTLNPKISVLKFLSHCLFWMHDVDVYCATEDSRMHLFVCFILFLDFIYFLTLYLAIILSLQNSKSSQMFAKVSFHHDYQTTEYKVYRRLN